MPICTHGYRERYQPSTYTPDQVYRHAYFQHFHAPVLLLNGTGFKCPDMAVYNPLTPERHIPVIDTPRHSTHFHRHTIRNAVCTQL